MQGVLTVRCIKIFEVSLASYASDLAQNVFNL